MTEEAAGSTGTERIPYRLKRPNLFVVKGILEFVKDQDEDSKAGLTTYSDFAEFSKGTTKNRRDLAAYLRLLCDDLGWLKREGQQLPSSHDGGWGWKILKTYVVTAKGKTFLSLFPDEEQNKKPQGPSTET